MAQRGANRQRKSSAPGEFSPLSYMLSVINDASAPVDRRDRMAICAAQYCHPRVAKHPKGQKVLAREAAAKAGNDDGWGSDLQYFGGRRSQ